jgi:hypothetical protein
MPGIGVSRVRCASVATTGQYSSEAQYFFGGLSMMENAELGSDVIERGRSDQDGTSSILDQTQLDHTTKP